MNHTNGNAGRLARSVVALVAVALVLVAVPAWASSIRTMRTTSTACVGPGCAKGDLPSDSTVQLSTASDVLADPFDPAQTLGVWFDSPTGGLNSLMTLEFAKNMGGGKLGSNQQLAISYLTDENSDLTGGTLQATVPEPGSLLLLATGLLFVARGMRRRLRAAN